MAGSSRLALPGLARRVSRRRVISSTLAAAGGLTALALVGCDSDDAEIPGAEIPTNTPPVDLTSPALPGAGTFDSSGVPIHYEVFSAGRPIILVHGFTASLLLNWVATGWVDELTPIRQVVGLDARGHGLSGKPREPEAYSGDTMPNDVIGLMDHLGIEQADLFGYSMGSAISLRAVANRPERFTSLILGGTGDFARSGTAGGDSALSDALLAEDPDSISDPTAKGFRVLAEALGNDLEALAAYSRAARPSVSDEALAGIDVPVLIVNGADDTLVGSPDELAAAIPTAELVKIPGKDHLTVVADPQFKETVVRFLSELPPV